MLSIISMKCTCPQLLRLSLGWLLFVQLLAIPFLTSIKGLALLIPSALRKSRRIRLTSATGGLIPKNT